MKMLLIAVALVMTTSAFAQKHMVQVGTDAQTLGSLAWSSEKSRGENSSEDKNYNLVANYAYTLTSNIQVGTKVELSKFKTDGASSENYGLQVGGIYNLNSDLKKSLYASLYVGWDWGRTAEIDEENSSTEDFLTTVAVGHRYPLSFLGLENVTYSPEIAFVSVNPTKKADTEWSQALEFRLIQFAVLF